MRVEAAGVLTITIRPDGLEAAATFVAGDGEPWTDLRLLEEMKRAGITRGYRPEEVRRAFSLAVRAGDGSPFRLACGTRPTDPRPERVQWAPMEVPPELGEQCSRVIAATGGPQIVVRRQERAADGCAVPGKTRLPVGPPQRSKAEPAEPQLVEERVYVDPTVERIGYAKAGQRLGTVVPRQNGAPGRTVRDEMIRAPVLPDPHYHAGPGVSRSRDELTAQIDGFVRIGCNWVDVVPFRPHEWRVTLSGDRCTALLHLMPGHRLAAAPSSDRIRHAAVDAGCPDDRLLPDQEIATLVARAIDNGTALEAAPLTRGRDGGFDIVVTADRLMALLNVHKAFGRGRPLSFRTLGSAIKQSGLAGLDYARIQADVSAFNRSSETDLVGYVLAKGTPAEPGPQRMLDVSVRFLPAEQTAVMLSRLERVLAKSRNAGVDRFPASLIEDIGPVEAEQRVLMVSPPVAGEGGTDVYGRPVPPPEPGEPPVELYGALERRGLAVVATSSGLLHRGWRDGVLLLRVLPHREGSVRLTVTEDRMVALQSITPPEGTAEPLAWGVVEEAIAGSGVRQGLDDELVLRAFTAARAGREIRDLVVARGKPPEVRDLSHVEILVASTPDGADLGDPASAPAGGGRLPVVAAGTQLARVRPRPEETGAGWDVFGTRVDFSGDGGRPVEAGANVILREDPDGSTVYTAEVDGEFVCAGHRFEVRPGRTMTGDVDGRSGNVEAAGTVTITGSVRSGLSVVCGGSVHVGGQVEAAVVRAGGDIVVSGGVKGGGHARLQADGAIGLTYAEQATVLAVGDLFVRRSLTHCDVTANGRVGMGSEPGAIVGGRLRCRQGLVTRNLGSERGVRTEVSIGQDYLVAERIERVERDIERLKQAILKLEFTANKAARGQRTDSAGPLHVRKLRLLKLLERKGLRLFALRERFEAHHESSIVVRGTLYPGVLVESHGRTLEVTSRRRNVVIRFDPSKGRIEERPG